MNKKGKFQNILQGAIDHKNTLQGSIKERIVIVEELKQLIPPLTKEEHVQLEENIIAEGCREAIILWNNQEEYILIDGHNRYGICKKHKIDFKIEIKDFENIEAVKDWMINNQLGKRNVTEKTKSYLRGTQYTLEKQKDSFKGNQYTKGGSGQPDHQQKTHERLAELFKVSPKTIQRDEKFAMAVNRISGENIEIKNKILNRDLQMPASQITEYGLQGSEKLIEALRDAILKGQPFVPPIEEEQEAIALETVTKPKIVIEKDSIDFQKKAIIKSIKKISTEQDIEEIISHLEVLRSKLKE